MSDSGKGRGVGWTDDESVGSLGALSFARLGDGDMDLRGEDGKERKGWMRERGD